MAKSFLGISIGTLIAALLFLAAGIDAVTRPLIASALFLLGLSLGWITSDDSNDNFDNRKPLD